MEAIRKIKLAVLMTQLCLMMWQLHRCGRAERSYSMFKDRKGSSEEMPLVQCKEQWLHFAGASMRRYPTSKVRK